ncbi:hypothetical protein [Sulfurimonas sp. NWX367]|uniref:hypothetical protein n=1 Tax=unclassified Sulfurimonas TaxID=2623549 RepID=UPI003204D96D
MGLSSNQFKELMTKGYQKRYKDNNNGESELRCFECGEKAQLLKKSSKWRIRCNNGHKWQMYKYLLEYTIMRDGITKCAIETKCDIGL